MSRPGWLAGLRDRLRGRAPRPEAAAQGPGARPPVAVHSLQMRLDPQEAIQSFMARGIYEPEQTEWAKECLAEGDRFVDVGANFGWYTALACGLVGKTGEIFSFEPSPVAAKVLAEAIKENGLRNVTLTRAAVGDGDGFIDLYMPTGDAVHSPSAFVSDPTFRPLKVPVLALDGFGPLADGRPVKLVKIDVEGYEPNVMRGMRELIRAGRVENLFCEFNSGWLKRNGATPEGLFGQISSYGLRAYKRTEKQVGEEGNGDPFECQDIWFKA